MDSKKRTLKRLGIAGVATAMTTLGGPALVAGASTTAIVQHSAATAPGAPAAPTGLKAVASASSATGGQVTLSWNAVGGAAGYNVYEGTGTGQETSTPVNGATLVSGTTVTLTGLKTDGTSYYFVVTAVNAAGESAASGEATATPQAAAPAAPTNVKATAGNQSATVDFTVPADNGDAITGFTVTPLIGGVPQTPQTETSTGTGTALDPTPGASDSFTASNLQNGTTYTFEVAADNAVGTGTASAASNAVTPAIGAPLAPTISVGSPTTSSLTLTITPNANTGGSAVIGYNVYEGTAQGGESSTPVNGASLIPANGTSPVSYVVNQLTPGKTYYFTAKAVNAQGASPASAEMSDSTTPAATGPAAPTNVSAVGGNTTATVKWTVPANNGTAITGFDITATPSGGSASQPFTVALGSTVSATPGATDTYTLPAASLTNGTLYTFQVAADNGTVGAYSSASNAVVPNVTIPSAPQDLAITSPVTGTTSSSTSLNLSWGAPADNGGSPITGYNLLWEPPGATSFTAVPSTNTTYTIGTSATVTGLTTGANYKFEVQAVNAQGTSPAASGSATVASLTPDAPTSFMASPNGSGTALLSWTPPVYQGDSSGTVTYTILEGGVPLVTGLSASTTSHSVTGLTNGTAYTFSVETVNSTGPTTSTNNPSATVTPVGVPGTVSVSAAVVSPTSVKVSWSAPASNGSSITGYSVTSEDTTANPNVAGPSCSTTTATSCTLTGLTEGDTYTFTVQATNSAGTSTVGTATATPNPQAPDAPTGLTVTQNAGDLIGLSWKAPVNDGGSSVTGYNVFVGTSPIGIGSTGNMINKMPITGTSATVDTATLFNGAPLGFFGGTVKLYFAVEAVNAYGHSVTSSAVSTSSSTQTTKPGAPARPTVKPEVGGKALVVWSPPSNDGNAPISGYFVTAHLVNGKGKTVRVGGGASSVTMSGLATGSYYFTVVAINVNGPGTPSAPSALVAIKGAAPVKVYVTPPAMLAKAGVTTIRVTTNKPGVQVHLFDEAFGTSHFFQKKIMTTTAQKNGTGVAIFKIGIARTNKFFVVADGVKSNVVVARVK